MAHFLHDFFYPKTVALIGATDKPDKPARAIMENLAHFSGTVFPVNPKYQTLFGLRCYPSIKEIAETIDVAIVALPVTAIESGFSMLRDKGIDRLIVISSGFAEAGEEGRRLQDRLTEQAKRHGIRVIGPNALGVFNAENGFNSFFVSEERVLMPEPGRLSIVSQSGAVTVILMEAMARNGIGIAKAINYGNRLDVDEADALSYLADDPQTDAAAVYMESVGDGRKFLEAAKGFTARKPLVVWKAGKRELGAGAVASHTATLAGTYALYEAAFRQGGISEAYTFEHLLDGAKVASLMPFRCTGKRLLIMTNGGGMAVAAADQASRDGFILPAVPENVRKKLKQTFPPFFVLNNPIDITGSGKDEDYYTALKEALPYYDAAVVIALMGTTTVTENSAAMIAKACRELKKPVTCCMLQGLRYMEEVERSVQELGIPAFPSPERAVRALTVLRRGPC